MSGLEKYFQKFRQNIIGTDATYKTSYGRKKIIYADWIASGRLYAPIKKALLDCFGPFVSNTHTETIETGTRMTMSCHHVHELIKKHVNAGLDEILYFAESLKAIISNISEWKKDYIYLNHKNEFIHRDHIGCLPAYINEWFRF